MDYGIEIDGIWYGTQSDGPLGPLGGGEGYLAPVFPPVEQFDDAEMLLAAVAAAEPGETIYIASGSTLNLTPYINEDGVVLDLPPDVTLAGDGSPVLTVDLGLSLIHI